MKTVHESAHGRAGAAATAVRDESAGRPTGSRRSGFVWRLRALVRLARRALHARRAYAELRHLDAATLRDLGLSASEIGSVAAELRGHAAQSRRRTDFETRSGSGRFRVREIDSAL